MGILKKIESAPWRLLNSVEAGVNEFPWLTSLSSIGSAVILNSLWGTPFAVVPLAVQGVLITRKVMRHHGINVSSWSEFPQSTPPAGEESTQAEPQPTPVVVKEVPHAEILQPNPVLMKEVLQTEIPQPNPVVVEESPQVEDPHECLICQSTGMPPNVWQETLAPAQVVEPPEAIEPVPIPEGIDWDRKELASSIQDCRRNMSFKYDKFKRIVSIAEDEILFRQESEKLEIRIRSVSEVWKFLLPNPGATCPGGMLIQKAQLEDALKLISKNRESVKGLKLSIRFQDNFIVLKEGDDEVAVLSCEGEASRFSIPEIWEHPWHFHFPEDRWGQVVSTCRATDDGEPHLYLKYTQDLAILGVSRWLVASTSVRENDRCGKLYPIKFSLPKEVILAYQNLFIPEEVDLILGEKFFHLKSPNGEAICPADGEPSPLKGKRLFFPTGTTFVVGTKELKTALKDVSHAATVEKPEEDIVSLIWKPDSSLQMKGTRDNKQVSFEKTGWHVNPDIPSSVTVLGRVLSKVLPQIKGTKINMHLPRQDRWEMLTLSERDSSFWVLPIAGTSAQVADLGRLYWEEAQLGNHSGSHAKREFSLWSQIEIEEEGLERGRKLARIALEFLQSKIKVEADPSEGLLGNKKRLAALLESEEDPEKLEIAASRVISLRRHTQYQKLDFE